MISSETFDFLVVFNCRWIVCFKIGIKKVGEVNPLTCLCLMCAQLSIYLPKSSGAAATLPAGLQLAYSDLSPFLWFLCDGFFFLLAATAWLTYGLALRVKETTTSSTHIRQSRRFPNRSVCRIGTRRCWRRRSRSRLSWNTR